MILDTTFIIDLMDQLPSAVRKQEELRQRRENLYITTPTVMELWSGVVQSSRPEQEKRKVVEVVESQLILDFDKASAEEAGKIDGTLYKEGVPIEPTDCMIAGIAQYHQEILLTKNLKHFTRIKGLGIETY